MEKSVQITLIIVIGLIVVAGMGYFAFSSLSPSTNTVTGNGYATIEAIPDKVGVYFDVQTKATTSEEATTKNSEIVDELITELVKQGFERKDIQTLNFNVYPEYDWNSGTRRIIGYQANHQIKVELSTSESSRIGKVIDSGVSAGAGISYINFELSQEKQNQYKAEALKLAAEDAKVKAESIAEGLGKKLGALVSTQDSNFGYNPWRLYEASGGMNSQDVAMAKEAVTNIQPGEQEISASVTATFRLK